MWAYTAWSPSGAWRLEGSIETARLCRLDVTGGLGSRGLGRRRVAPKIEDCDSAETASLSLCRLDVTGGLGSTRLVACSAEAEACARKAGGRNGRSSTELNRSSRTLHVELFVRSGEGLCMTLTMRSDSEELNEGALAASSSGRRRCPFVQPFTPHGEFSLASSRCT